MRISLLIFVSAILLSACNRNSQTTTTVTKATDSTFVVSGNIAGLDTGSIVFVHREGDDKVFDTLALKKGAFEYTGKIREGLLGYTAFILGKDQNRIDFLLENANITLTAKADSFKNATITGAASQADLDLFKQQTKSIDNSLDEIVKGIDNATSKVVNDSLEKLYDQFDSLKQAAVSPFVKAHPKSYTSAYLVSRILLVQPKVDVIEGVYNDFEASVKASKYGKVVKEELDALKISSIGQIAPDFTMDDTTGKPVTLSSFRGKYLLVDLWASWCGPCRRENPNVVKAYAKYHSPKFDILGVSLDSKRDPWIEAINKDKLAWNHVSDLKGWGNAVSKQYGVRAIPANLLLDPAGKIIARNIMGEELKAKLKEVLK